MCWSTGRTRSSSTADPVSKPAPCGSPATRRSAGWRSGWPPASVAGSTTPRPSSMPGWPTAPGCTPCSARWPLREPACRCGCRRPVPSRWTTAWRGGSVSPVAAEVLRRVVEQRLAFLISGGTGSGKTTLLAALLGLVPPEQRIVIVEDSRELNPAHPHVVRLEGRPVNAEQRGAITLTDLVRQALRMRPDRLVVGEVRGAEIADLLTAMNTGHEGGCGTVHANSAADVPARLEALAALGQLGRAALHAQLAAALDLVVHIRRHPSGRREVTELNVLSSDPVTGLVRTEPALAFAGRRTSRGPGAARPRTDVGPMIALCVTATRSRRAAADSGLPRPEHPRPTGRHRSAGADRSTPLGVRRVHRRRERAAGRSAASGRGPGGCGGGGVGGRGAGHRGPAGGAAPVSAGGRPTTDPRWRGAAPRSPPRSGSAGCRVRR